MKPASDIYRARSYRMLFSAGWPTDRIAQKYQVTEAEVYNTLARIKGQLHERDQAGSHPHDKAGQSGSH